MRAEGEREASMRRAQPGSRGRARRSAATRGRSGASLVGSGRCPGHGRCDRGDRGIRAGGGHTRGPGRARHRSRCRGGRGRHARRGGLRSMSVPRLPRPAELRPRPIASSSCASGSPRSTRCSSRPSVAALPRPLAGAAAVAWPRAWRSNRIGGSPWRLRSVTCCGRSSSVTRMVLQLRGERGHLVLDDAREADRSVRQEAAAERLLSASREVGGGRLSDAVRRDPPATRRACCAAWRGSRASKTPLRCGIGCPPAGGWSPMPVRS